MPAEIVEISQDIHRLSGEVAGLEEMSLDFDDFPPMQVFRALARCRGELRAARNALQSALAATPLPLFIVEV